MQCRYPCGNASHTRIRIMPCAHASRQLSASNVSHRKSDHSLCSRTRECSNRACLCRRKEGVEHIHPPIPRTTSPSLGIRGVVRLSRPTPEQSGKPLSSPPFPPIPGARSSFQSHFSATQECQSACLHLFPRIGYCQPALLATIPSSETSPTWQ